MSLQMHLDKTSFEIFEFDGLITHSLLLVICGLLFVYFLWRPKRNLPPGPLGLPLVGYLPFLGKQPFRTLDNLSKTYGKVFSLYLGQKYVVILGDDLAVKEAYGKSVTLNRPEGIFDFQPDAFGIANFNGEKWIEQRRIVMRTMKDLGFGGSTLEHLFEDEVSHILKIIANTKGAPMYIGDHLISGLSSNIASFVFGKKLPQGNGRDTLISGLHAAMAFFAQAGLWNFFPWICNIMVKIKTHRFHELFSKMGDMNRFLRKETEIHNSASDVSKGTDFVSCYMDVMKNRGKDADTDINGLIGNIQALFVGGTETTHTSLLWLFLAMIAYPHVQRKVHLELDSILGKQQRPSWKDRPRLPYCNAVVMEGQRWRTVVPLSLARIASADFNLCGYDVPKGSLIIPNLWALHNDLRFWKDPENFIPERFLENDGKIVKIKLDSYAPFSWGRRKCPGENVGLMGIFRYFTSIMHKYEVRHPEGKKTYLEGVLGTTYVPIKQDLCFIPR